MPTYSFNDTLASLIGPGGNVSLAAGAGAAEEGITVEMVEQANFMTIGAGGEGMHSSNTSRAAKISVRLLKTSPVNQQLSQMYAIQKGSSGAWGNNVFSLKNNVSGDSITAAQVAFAKFPNVTYAKNPLMNEWTFDSIDTAISLGGGIVANIATFIDGSL